MAVDFSIFARVPTIGSQIMAGQEAGREAAARNMLLQQRALEFQQAQEERKLAMEERRMQREAVAAQVARRGQLAQLLRQSGMDPSDMQSATQFYAAALEANEPTAIAAAKDWLSIARETAQSRAAGAEYQGIMGGAPASAPMAAAPMAVAPAPAPAPMAVSKPPFGARETYDAGEVSPGGAVSFAVAPPPAPMPPTGANMLAPQVPAAPPVNQLAAAPAPAPAAAPTPAPAKDDAAALRAEAQRLEAAQQRLRQSPFEKNQKRAQELDKPIERLLKRADDIEKAAPGTQPKPEKLQLGDRVAFVDMNPNSPTFRQEILSQQVGAAPEAPGAAASRAIQDRRVQLEAERLELERKRVAQQAERDAARDRRDAAAEARLERQLAQTDRRLAIAEEDARRAGDPAFQQRMANARVTGEAIAKGDVAAQRLLPQTITRAEDGIRLIDEMIGRPEERDASGKVIRAATKPHPGFEDAVGATWKPGFRFIPGTNAANFMARFDQINGQAFLEAFETLKGGGAITEPEGVKGTQAISRARIAQSEAEFISAMRDLQSVVRKGVENAKRKASLGPAAPGGAPAAGVDTNNPLLK